MRQMKDSGIEWIGEIPEGWEVKRIKFLFSERNERCDNNTNLPLLSVSEYYGVAQRKEKIKEEETLVRASSLDGYKICYQHDIVINIMLAWRSSLGESPVQGIVSPSYCVYKPILSNIYSRYYHYLFRTDIYANVFKQYSTGIIDSRLRLYSDKFFSLFVQLPPLAEQQRIADYLDAKCAHIDQCLELTRQSMEKLRAYKLSCITEAVTKGLDPDVPFKDSGVPWIGQIPAGWTLTKILRALDMPITDGPHETPEFFESGIPFISAESIKNEKIDFSLKRGFISEDFYNYCCNKYKPKLNDIYMIKSGATTGKIAIVSTTEKFQIWSPLAVFRVNSKNNYRFIFYSLQSTSFQRQIENNWSYGTQQNIGMRTLEKIPLPLPPLPEQERIAAYLDKKCARIDALLEEKQALLDKLAEYKKSLIFECVTGKREVPSCWNR